MPSFEGGINKIRGVSMSYCIYLRKSRADEEAEAHGEGETLARHETALLATAKRMSLDITEIYREILSGESIAGRPVMQRLLSEVEQGAWDGVLVMEIERLARGDTIDQGIVAQTFKYSDTLIITPTKVYDPNNEFDEEYFEFGLFMSRREYKTINRRLQRGRIASVKEGKFIGHTAPYGYKRVKLDKQKGWTLEPIDAEADIIRLIFNLYAYGSPKDGHINRIGTAKIARELNNLHLLTRTGQSWTYQSILGILRNPAYIGKIRYNSRPSVKKMVNGKVKTVRPRVKDCSVIDGMHKAIVDTKTWSTVQNILLKNPPTQVDTRRNIKNPLAGLVICGICGKTMIRKPYANGHISGLICRTVGCKTVGSDLPLVEEKLLKTLSAWLNDYKLSIQESKNHTKTVNLIDFNKKSIKKLYEDIETLDKQLETAYDLLERKVYTEDVFLSRTKNISERKQTALSQIDELKEKIKINRNRQIGEKKLIPKVENILAVYHHTSNALTLNQLLKEVIDHIVYTKFESGRWDQDKQSAFNLDLFMKIPKE